MMSLTELQEFIEAEREIRDLLWLKKAGLSYNEVKLYQANEAGLLDQKMKVEHNDMAIKLEAIYNKMKKYADENEPFDVEDLKIDVSSPNSQDGLYKAYQTPLSFYPEGHPMNRIKEIEVDVFGHNSQPLSKRRQMLKHFERKKDRVLAHEKQVNIAACGLDIPVPRGTVRGRRRRTLSDMDLPVPQNSLFAYDYYHKTGRSPKQWYEHAPASRNRNDYHPGQRSFNEHPEDWRNRKHYHLKHKCDVVIGPRSKQKFIVRGNQIFRIDAGQLHNINEDWDQEEDDIEEDDSENEDSEEDDTEEVEDSVEDELLEGTKMPIDDIRGIERFTNYDPGTPSRTLHLDNIAPQVTQAQLSILFNQFILANGGPVEVRLMTYGRMMGQAFVEFQREDLCIQALSEANGTILCRQPIIAQFARAVDMPRLDNNR